MTSRDANFIHVYVLYSPLCHMHIGTGRHPSQRSTPARNDLSQTVTGTTTKKNTKLRVQEAQKTNID